MRTCALCVALLLAVTAFPALAGELTTVLLRVDGKAVKSTAISDGREVYLPLDALKLLSCTSRVNPRGDAAQVRFPNGEAAEVGLARLRGEQMVPFSAIRSKLGMSSATNDGVCDLRSGSSPSVKLPTGVQGTESIDPASTLAKKPAAVVAKKPVEVETRSPAPPQKKTATAAESTTQKSSRTVALHPIVSAPRLEPPSPESIPTQSAQPRLARAAAPDSRSSAIQPAETLDGQAHEQVAVDIVPPIPFLPTKRGLRVTDVAMQSIDETHARLRISTTGRPAINARLISGPSRLVIDIPNCQMECEAREWESDHPFASGIRAVDEKPGTARIVVELERLVTYRILSADSAGVTVNLATPRGSGMGLDGRIIAVDPGHGGPSSTGCHAVVNGKTVLEKHLTLLVARRVVRILQEMGANVIMTRNKDEEVGLKTRPTIANDNNADAFISLHVDDYPGHTSASGSTAYFHMDDASSRALGHSIVERMAQISGLPNRGSRSDRVRFQNGMAVLRYSTMPATLIEMAYISNPGDRAKLMSEQWQEKIARSICDGIRAYFEGALPEDKLGKG